MAPVSAMRCIHTYTQARTLIYTHTHTHTYAHVVAAVQSAVPVAFLQINGRYLVVTQLLPVGSTSRFHGPSRKERGNIQRQLERAAERDHFCHVFANWIINTRIYREEHRVPPSRSSRLTRIGCTSREGTAIFIRRLSSASWTYFVHAHARTPWCTCTPSITE